VVTLLSTLGGTDTLTEASPGNYTADILGVVNEAYWLEITTPDGVVYETERETLNSPSNIDSIYHKTDDLNGREEEGQFVFIDFVEPQGEGDFYKWKHFIDGEEQIEPEDFSVFEDRFSVFPDTTIIIKEYRITERPVELGSEVRVEQFKISAEHYSFVRDVLFQSTLGGTPFDTPPSPIFGNVHEKGNFENKALGYFMVASKVSKALTVNE
ncbi:MAG: DUF4249 domain-containing protein, partial [Cyclobacteriaceae bacterium]